MSLIGPLLPSPVHLGTAAIQALVLIDHQPGIALLTQSIDKTLLLNNVAALAGVAAALKVPTVLTTIDANSETTPDPIFHEISEAFPSYHSNRPFDHQRLVQS